MQSNIISNNKQRPVIRIKNVQKKAFISFSPFLCTYSGYSKQGFLNVLNRNPLAQTKLLRIIRLADEEFNRRFDQLKTDIENSLRQELAEFIIEFDLFNHNRRGRKKKQV